MTIDWMHFTPWASLTGGLILGVASAMFILLNGRILGISGILGGLMPPQGRRHLVARCFFAGHVCSAHGVSCRHAS